MSVLDYFAELQMSVLDLFLSCSFMDKVLEISQRRLTLFSNDDMQ